MRRGAVFLAMLVSATLGVSVAQAQGPVVFYLGAQGDTATGAVPGAETQVPVRSINPWYYYAYNYNSVASATLTFVYDTNKIQVLGVVPPSIGGGLYSINSTVAGPGTFTVSASGYAYGYDAALYQLRVKLKGGVTDGTYLWVKNDSAALCYYSNCDSYGTHYRQTVSAIGQVCHATEVWGDVDGNFQVDSRDALITLSAAVGLPVTGFNLSAADVDGDGLANSRDALLMLTYAIGLDAGTGRVGVGVPDACPGLTPPGETVVFNRNVGGSGGIFRLDSLSTTPLQLTALLGDRWPRLNAAGTAMVFQCIDGYGYNQICRADPTGSNRTMLTGPDYPDRTIPDWSPDAAHVVFLYGTVGVNTDIYTMDSTGANQFPAYSSGMFASAVAWSRNNTVFALTAPSHYGLYTTQIGVPYSTALDANYGYITYAAPIRWSPDGTVIAAINNNNVGGILTLPAAGGTSVPALAPSGIRAYDWGSQGIIFSMPDVHGVSSLWLLRGGFGGPVVRLTNPGSGGADDQPSFRRNP